MESSVKGSNATKEQHKSPGHNEARREELL